MRSQTRRQQIVGERRREQIRFLLLAIAALAFLIIGAASCSKGCGAKEPEPVVTVTDTPKDELVLTGADIAYLRTLTEYPRLVNADSPLSGGFVPPDLVQLYGIPDGVDTRLNSEAAAAFYRLRDGMLADGMAVLPLSGYRTYDEQVSIFNYNVQLHTDEGMTAEEAREYTMRFVAYPGTSEHQYGRSLDVTIDGTTDHDFDETEQGAWLAGHAYEYGFVIRYPDSKVDITGINYEPWHLRWVGEEHARFMYEHGLCLEEYILLVQQYSPGAVQDQ